MKTLDQIAQECGTDKSSSTHNYAVKYDHYFSEFRESNIKIFEIGIQNGYSLKMWKEYFTKAQIHALDIVDLRHMKEDRVEIFVGSQNDERVLADISNQNGPFDIIIDDGSHHNESMTISFNTLFPLLKPGGLYVIEDLSCCYWPWIQKDINLNFNEVLKQLLDHVHASGYTGIGSKENNHKDPVFKQDGHKMTWWDMNVEYLHVYRNIAFIKKYEK